MILLVYLFERDFTVDIILTTQPQGKHIIGWRRLCMWQWN